MVMLMHHNFNFFFSSTSQPRQALPNYRIIKFPLAPHKLGNTQTETTNKKPHKKKKKKKKKK
jgi:hypothetical protein